VASPTSLNRGTHDWSDDAYIATWLESANRRDQQRGFHFWLMTKLLPFQENEQFKVADVGCGAGAAAQAVLEAFPNSQAVCVDGSEAMLNRARQELGSFGDRVSYLKGDFTDEHWLDPLKGTGVRAVVSSKAIHNLFDVPAVRQVYRTIGALLETDGCFINIDNVAPAPLLREQFDAAHRARREREGSSRPRNPNQPAPAGERFAGSLQDHFNWLHEFGFREADCAWREMQTVILVGRK